MTAKVLVFDVETFPLLAYVWGLKDQNISLPQIVKDWELAAWGAKWLGTPASAVMYQDRRDRSEKQLLQGIWKLLNEADIVITQNGKSFDSRKLNARFIHYGLMPPKPYKHIDTYLLVKNVADFTSNKLEYLTDKLCVKYKKLSHSKFPGWSLWIECMKNNIKAWTEMKEYNIHDVLSTEELYEAVKAWGPKNTPAIYRGVLTCPACGETAQRRGTDMVGKTLVQRLRCTKCGKWGTEPLPKAA